MRTPPVTVKYICCHLFFLIIFISVFFSSNTSLAQTSTEISGIDSTDLTIAAPYNRANSYMHTPAAVTVIDETEIRRNGAERLQDILMRVPGFWFADMTYLYPISAIRESACPGYHSMQIFIDGMPLINPMSASVYYPIDVIPLALIEKIEILKGSWGGRYGTNSATGIIHIYTKKPTDRPGLQIHASGSTLSSFTSCLQYSRMIIPEMFASADLTIYANAGYHKNPAFDGATVTIPPDINTQSGLPAIPNHFTANDVDGQLAYVFGLNFQGQLMPKLSTRARLQFEYIQSKSYTSSIFSDFDLPFVTNTNALKLSLSDHTRFELNDWNSAHAQMNLYYLGNTLAYGGGLSAKHMMFELELTDQMNVTNNDLTFGLHIRSVATATTTSNIRDVNFNPEATTDLLYAGFFQDRIYYQNRLEILLGIRAETWTQMSYKPVVMPNFRISFCPSESVTVWGAFGQSAVAPGYWETYLEYRKQSIPYISAERARFIADQNGLAGAERDNYLQQQAYFRSLFLPGTNELYIAMIPASNLKPMKYNSFEYGFRKKLDNRALIDIAGYYMKVKDGIGPDVDYSHNQTVYSEIFPTATIWPIYYFNNYQSNIFGGELNFHLLPSPNLNINISYALFNESRDFTNSQATPSATQSTSPAAPTTPTHILRLHPEFFIPKFNMMFSIYALWASECERGVPFNYLTQRPDHQASQFTYPAGAQFQLDFYVEKSFFQNQLHLYAYGKDIFTQNDQRYYSDAAPIGFPHTVHGTFGGGLNLYWKINNSAK
ncbi:TonB-dependent receptor plug domain-containing protein [candidate division KSB1 bacterium]|nr:TonB-dependent receptor plug domain-containing protein [candidate division KSB1 bacterium]